MNKKHSRKKRKELGIQRLLKQAKNSDFDIPLSEENVQRDVDPSMDPSPSNFKSNDQKEFTQIRKNFIFSLLIFSLFFIAVIVLYQADKNLGIVDHVLSRIGIIGK